jgi:hypothetical protein
VRVRAQIANSWSHDLRDVACCAAQAKLVATAEAGLLGGPNARFASPLRRGSASRWPSPRGWSRVGNSTHWQEPQYPRGGHVAICACETWQVNGGDPALGPTSGASDGCAARLTARSSPWPATHSEHWDWKLLESRHGTGRLQGVADAPRAQESTRWWKTSTSGQQPAGSDGPVVGHGGDARQ